jgi:hypothetical protein
MEAQTLETIVQRSEDKTSIQRDIVILPEERGAKERTVQNTKVK